MSDTSLALSVIIPYHNRNDELNALLATFPDRADIEVILVDDRSTEPVELTRVFAATKVLTLHTSGEDRFAGAARNIGLSAASGEFIYFCDSDDLLETGEFLKALEYSLTSEADVIFTLCDSYRPDGSQAWRHCVYNFYVREFLRTGNQDHLVRFLPPWAKFIRRGFIEAHQLHFDAIRVSNDVMFTARLFAARPRCEAFEAITYKVCAGNPSLTSVTNLESILQRIDTRERYNALLAQSGLGKYRASTLYHLKKIWRSHRRDAFRAALGTLKKGQPVFQTFWELKSSLHLRLATRLRRYRGLKA